MIRSCLLIVLLLTSYLAVAEKITLANGEWAPYLSENLKHYGYISRIVKEAFEEEGYEVEYVFLPWKRSEREKTLYLHIVCPSGSALHFANHKFYNQ